MKFKWGLKRNKNRDISHKCLEITTIFFYHKKNHKIREISATAAGGAGPGGLILVLRDVVHISVYRQRIYYLLCSLQYINKCTITVLTKKYFCIYYYVCAMNIVTIMLNNRSTLLLDQLTIAITYYQFMKFSNTTKQFKNK